MVRIALFADIHGNSLALDAVLEDIRALGGVDQYCLLGDLAAIGYDPVGTLQRLTALPDATFVRGNTDRYLATGHTPGPTVADCEANPALWPVRAETAASFAWSQGAVMATGWHTWLGSRPLEHRFVLPDGTHVLCAHASPGNDDGQGIHPGVGHQAVADMVSGTEAELIFVGHTHWAMDLMVGGKRLINTGSVSNPFPPDLRASYVWLEGDGTGYRLQHRRVAYDRAAVISELQRSHHPGREFIVRHLRGEIFPHWWEAM